MADYIFQRGPHQSIPIPSSFLTMWQWHVTMERQVYHPSHGTWVDICSCHGQQVVMKVALYDFWDWVIKDNASATCPSFSLLQVLCPACLRNSIIEKIPHGVATKRYKRCPKMPGSASPSTLWHFQLSS